MKRFLRAVVIFVFAIVAGLAVLIGAIYWIGKPARIELQKKYLNHQIRSDSRVKQLSGGGIDPASSFYRQCLSALSEPGKEDHADIDGDGKPDAITIENALEAHIVLSRGKKEFTLGGGGEVIDRVGFADIDRDGNLDAWFGGYDEMVTGGILWGDGKGGYQGIEKFRNTGAASAFFADVDSNGFLDIVYEVDTNQPTSSPRFTWTKLQRH